MTVYLGLLIACSCLVILIVRLKRTQFYQLARNSVSVVNELISDADEDQKIESVQKATNRLTISLLRVIGIVLLGLILGFLPLLIYLWASGPSNSAADVGPSSYAIIAISIGATLAFIIPFPKKNHISDYSELSQLLHHLALDNYQLSRKLFKREKKKYLDQSPSAQTQFVIVSGLARAGTTSFMNALSDSPVFNSLNYGNMPFILSPKTWSKLYKPKLQEDKERSHKDGIFINQASNEALEEYFFKVVANDDYIEEHHLREYEISSEDYKDYLDYQSLIRQTEEQIYLAKNNNFILRYRSVRKMNDEFLMVILFREPLAHATSLREKHHYYSGLQEEDPFVLDYMNWLGHHEFGNGHLPFHFEGESLNTDSRPSELDYWLERWISYYDQAIKLAHRNSLFIDYKSYCQEPTACLNRVFTKLSLPLLDDESTPFNNERPIDAEYSEELFQRAFNIHQQLVDLSA